MGRGLDPEQAVAVMHAADLDPQVPYPGANRPWKCICLKCENSCAPTLANVKRGRRCARCFHKRRGEKQRGTPAPNRLNPDDAVGVMRAAGLNPKVPYPGARKPWKSECLKCGDDCAPTLDNVKKRGRGCTSCGNRSSSEKQLGDPLIAEADMRAAGIEPNEPYPGSRTSWRGECMRCHRPVAPKLTDIRNGRGGCWHCGTKKRGIARRNDSAAAVQVMLDAGLKPLEPYTTSNVPWKCRCMDCGQIVTPICNNVKRRGSGCGYCAGRIVDTEEAAAFMRSVGAEPCEPYPGSHVPWRCVCTACGTKISPHYANARRGSGVCQSCAIHGMSFGDPAVVYLLRHEDLEALKVGIASRVSRTDRIAQHAFKGWKTIGSWSTPTGFHAAAVELGVLNWWRNELGAPVALTKRDMPQGGYTETVSELHVDLAETLAKIESAVAAANQVPDAYMATPEATNALMKDG
jgi:hypothetical protein